MSKKAQNDIPADMWLHVASDALARYASAGGQVDVIVVDGEWTIILPGVGIDDYRLAESFAALLFQQPAAEPEVAP